MEHSVEQNQSFLLSESEQQPEQEHEHEQEQQNQGEELPVEKKMETNTTIVSAEAIAGQPDGFVYNGIIKWFNSKSGYGFITFTSDIENIKDRDIFVHHSKINVSDKIYRYLCDGEKVTFSVCKSEANNTKHQYQASGVKGDGSSLICEHQISRNNNDNNRFGRGGGGRKNGSGYRVNQFSSRNNNNNNGSGNNGNSNSEWKFVTRRR